MGRRYTSPEILYTLFGFLHVVSLFYFSLNPDEFQRFLRLEIEPSLDAVYQVCFFKILIDIVYLIVSVSYSGKAGAGFITTFMRISRLDIALRSIPEIKAFALLLFFVGLIFTYLLINYAGGLAHLWVNIGMRSDLFEGSGAYLTIARNSLQFSGFLLFIVYAMRRKVLVGVFWVILVGVFLGLTGSRSSFIFLVFAAALFYYSKIKEPRFSLNLIICFFVFMVLFASLGKLRHNSISDYGGPLNFVSSAVTEMPSHLVDYVSQLRRDVVILRYFGDHEFWYGDQYRSLLMAPLPRNYFPEKPVLDGGRYVVGMYEGLSVEPVMKLKKLPTTGWPEGNMAGYMNFGLVGLIAYTIISAVIVKSVYVSSLVGSLALNFLYAYVVFIVPVTFDPYGMFKFALYLATLFLFGLFFFVFRIFHTAFRRSLL
jgi:hypothetical protein